MSSTPKRKASLFSRLFVLVALLLPAVLLASVSPAAAQNGVSTIEVDPQQSPSATDPTPVWAILERHGLIYIAGQFTTVEGQTQSYIAAVNATTGQIHAPFNPVVSDGNTEIKAMAFSPDGNSLYIGGIFRSVNGVSRDRIAKINAFTGALDTAFNPVASAAVETIAVDASGVYVGGRFSTIGGTSSPNLAKLNPTTGQADPFWFATTNGTVLDIELFSTNVYVGGNFTQIAGQPLANLARLESFNGAVQNNWNPAASPPERVQAVALSANGQTVFAGTAGSLANGNNGNSVWAHDVQGARLWQVALGGDVQALEARGDDLFVGTHGIYVFDEIRFQLDGTTLNPNFPASGYVEAGTNPNATRRDKLFSLNQVTGALQPWNPDLNSINGVWEIESGPSGLLVGGDFTEVVNPTGVGGNFDTIAAYHTAIFSNPVAVAPPPIDPPNPGGTPGSFACSVTTTGNNATITYSGDRGTSNQLIRNGSWIGTVTNSTTTNVSGGAGDTFSVRVRGAAYADPFQDITCSGGGGGATPPPANGNFACTVTTSNGNANITFTGDQGSSTNLLRNEAWIRTTTGSTFEVVAGGAGDSYTVRIRGAAYADPFQDITCT